MAPRALCPTATAAELNERSADLPFVTNPVGHQLTTYNRYLFHGGTRRHVETARPFLRSSLLDLLQDHLGQPVCRC